MENTRKQQTAKERRKRNPYNSTPRKLTIDSKTADKLKKAGMVPRWVNDDNHGANIQEKVNRGYDFIASGGEVIVGDNLASEDKGRRLRALVNKRVTPPVYAYLMAIDEKFYQEDQGKKEAQNMLVDEAIQGGNAPGVNPHGVAPDKGGTYKKNIQYSP